MFFLCLRCYFFPLAFFQGQKWCLEAPFLHQTTGYHPFFLQLLCYHLYTRINETGWLEEAAKEEALRAFEQDVDAHFAYYWHLSSQEEQKVMKKLASGQAIDWNRYSGIAYRLQDRCLSIKTDACWRLFCSPFAKWVNQQKIMAKAAYQPPIRSADAYDFVDREQELNQLSALLHAHPYVHLYGPIGVGKTALVAQLLQTRYAEQNTAYLDLNDPKFRAQSLNPERLLREIARQFYNSLRYRALSLPELIDRLSYRINQTGQSGLIVLDNIERMTPSMRRQLREEVLPALQDRITEPTRYLRLITIAQTQLEELRGSPKSIYFQPYPLAEFGAMKDDWPTYKSFLMQAVNRFADGLIDPNEPNDDNLLREWAYALYDLTAGHPRTIEETLNYVGEHQLFAKSNVFEEQREAICHHVLAPQIEQQVQACFSNRKYQQAFQQLWIFRYLSKSVFRQVLRTVKDKDHWSDLNAITGPADYDPKYAPLWERLIETPLLQSEGIDRSRLLSHQLNPIWRKQGNLILQATAPLLYKKLHGDAFAVFEHFAFGETTRNINMRINCFIEALYHLTQQNKIDTSNRHRSDFTQKVVEFFQLFLLLLKEEEFFDENLYQVKKLLQSDQELQAELNQVGLFTSDIFGATETEIEADDKRWDELFNKGRDKMRMMALEALDEIHAGQ